MYYVRKGRVYGKIEGKKSTGSLFQEDTNKLTETMTGQSTAPRPNPFPMGSRETQNPILQRAIQDTPPSRPDPKPPIHRKSFNRG